VDHLVDAAAWRVSFQIPKAIGGTGVETDAAVDAAGEVFVRGILAGDRGSGGHFWCRVRFLGLRETVARREKDGAGAFQNGIVPIWDEEGYTPVVF
jgi:hypothetical protein